MTPTNQKNYLKKVLFILIILFIILIFQLIRVSQQNNTSQQNKTVINYRKLNKELDNYLKKDSKSNSISSHQTLTKLRTALFLYLQDHYQLPDHLTQLIGNYIKSIPTEPLSNKQQITDKLNYQGGWFYDPQPITTDITTLINASLKPNTKVNYNTSFQPYYLLINTKEDKLYLKQDNKVVNSYPIASGSQTQPTPVGEFRINQKAILTNNKRKDYGKYWIGLNLWTKGGGYGLHATTNQQPITDQTSQGCIRLRPSDIAKLYQLIPLQTKVVIK